MAMATVEPAVAAAEAVVCLVATGRRVVEEAAAAGRVRSRTGEGLEAEMLRAAGEGTAAAVTGRSTAAVGAARLPEGEGTAMMAAVGRSRAEAGAVEAVRVSEAEAEGTTMVAVVGEG
mmetsp:Transcript_36237/g.85978  ORF Transcript_36237/g.85978 Transcript_36237/m.85978 type:complete len:118 (+) Transcript_36237:794-1147(+)